MKLLPPTVGPIVGHTTTDATRIWLRGDVSRREGGYRRAFGAVRIRALGARQWGAPVFTKLQPHFDATGICVMQGLAAATEHEYQAGWFHAERELTELRPAMPLDWSVAATGGVRTTPATSDVPRRYVVGSCRYLLRMFDGALFDERGDKTFRSILAQHEAPDGRLDGLVMLGDQIYADDLGLFGAERSVDDYLARYRLVFGQQALRRLMSLVPSYMILDDHEIEDNWPNRATSRDRVTLYPAAIHAYQVYQASHSPLFGLSSASRVDGTPTRFWYTFNDGCCDWFVMDTRTERRYRGGPDEDRMLDDRQFAALLDWLGDSSGRVKLIASSVPFFPDVEGDGSDKWTGFRRQRAEILDHIFRRKVPRVVFVSGDVHCSFVAELTATGRRGPKVTQIVSSSFFWPYPHTGSREFRRDGRLDVPRGGAAYRVSGPPEVLATDNFARLDVSPDAITVRYFGRKGQPLAPARRVGF